MREPSMQDISNKLKHAVNLLDVKDADLIVEAARAGDAYAQYLLGVMYEEGYRIQSDEAEATKWYLKAAQQGHPIAQKDMGYRYLNGEGTAVNYEESLKWFKEAKKNGYNDIEDYIPIDSLIEEINSLILRLNENERETSDD